MNTNLCPLRGMRQRPDGEEPRECLKSLCGFWTCTYTTEHMRWEGCAFEAMALKGPDGRIIV